MKNALIGFVLGALLTGGAFMWIPSEKPLITPVCQEQEKIIETKFVENECPVVDDSKIEKAFLLFLASIGIKKDYSSDVKSLIKNPENFDPSFDEINDSSEIPQISETQFFYPRDEALKTFNSGGVLQEMSDYNPSIKSTVNYLLKEPAVYFARSKTIQEMKVLRRLNGVYSGKLYRLTGKHKGKVEDVEMSIEYWHKNKNEIDGKFNMTIARDGVVYSNMRGEGGNNDLYLNPQKPNEIIIKAAPGMYFHFIDPKMQSANVYDEGVFIGVAKLQKL